MFLHFGELHLVFNMLWMWYFGKQLEGSLPAWLFLSSIILISVISNTVQYLVSGYNNFGGMSGVISRTLTAPLELSKIQQQNRFMPNTTLVDVIKKEGILGLWKGNYSNCVRIFPQMAINFSCFQYFDSFISQHIHNKQVSSFISGGLAGMIAVTIIYPLENARSRLSLQTNKDHYKGLTDVLRKTPPRQLYNGLKMSLIGYTPYNALNFMFYSMFKNVIYDSKRNGS